MMLMLLSGCNERDSIFDVFGEDNPDVIHIGGIQNSGIETVLGGYTSRAGGSNDANAPVNAETKEWLLGPLFGGLDITYGAKGNPATNSVAILKLLKKDENGGITPDNIKYSEYKDADGKDIAEYSFKYRTGGEDAKWYGNGFHTFQGVFVPTQLRYLKVNQTQENVNGIRGTAPNLKTDQSKDDQTKAATDPEANYTLLERYLGMPADANIQATVGRIKLPFRHRLARVIAYILIDPTMGSNVKIEGYNYHEDKDPETSKTVITPDNASTSKIKFCNVDVLAGVEEVDESDGHATLTPRWDISRKVIPHFVEESVSKNSKGEVVDQDNFIMFYDTEYKAYIYPTDDDDWAEANRRWNTKYTDALNGKTDPTPEEIRRAIVETEKATNLKRTVYGKVPVYDLIVRPTYDSEDMVMYDEDMYDSQGAIIPTKRSDLARLTNNIDFEITLDNGLEYSKKFTFDLNANHQNIVYLRINRESIDYNTSGAEVWDEDKKDDDYYGVNNQNGNTLSIAGSSWQRAYRFSTKDVNVTDGHYYGKDDDKTTDDDNMPNYPQYVDQTKWIEMFAEARKDGLHHGDYFILDGDITIDAKLLPDNFVFTGHLDGQNHTITLTGMGEKVVDKAAWDEDNYEEATSADYSSTLYLKVDGVYHIYVKPTLYVYHEAIEATYYETVDEYNEGHKNDVDFTPIDETTFSNMPKDQKIKTPAKEAEYVEASPQPTIAEMMSGTYYERIGEEYRVHHPELWANHPIHHPEESHISGSTLFAGLNGKYDASVGEANVHKEGDRYVPYTDGNTGWRAEVINTKITGADMFPSGAITDGTYDVEVVSGYVYNCWKVEGTNKTAIKSHTPALPKYK